MQININKANIPNRCPIELFPSFEGSNLLSSAIYYPKQFCILPSDVCFLKTCQKV